MKLVIDIPENLYEGIERRDGELETEYVCNELMKAVDNGTPLDKIRAEINAHRETLETMADDDWYAGKLRGYECAIEIIDKYKAKTEQVGNPERLEGVE